MKKLLILLPLFLLILLPNKVFALPSNTGIIEFKVNGVEFVNNNGQASLLSSTSHNLKVEINTNILYSYYIVYFAVPPEGLVNNNRFYINVYGGCDTSCFGNSYYLKLIGNIRGSDYYAIVLPSGKSDCGVGTGQCLIDNYVEIASTTTSPIYILGVDATNDDTVINNNYSGFVDLINNSNTNTQDIINNQNQNSQNIINNQNQNQQQTNEKLDGINDSLTNSKVEGGTGSSFFNDFSTTDNGGISSIITAPLVAINSMLDNTCSPMSVNYKGKDVSLPCGTEFWAKATTIQEYLNWFEGGILVYLIIRKLYKLIEGMKNPDDDRVEVMDL